MQCILFCLKTASKLTNLFFRLKYWIMKILEEHLWRSWTFWCSHHDHMLQLAYLGIIFRQIAYFCHNCVYSLCMCLCVCMFAHMSMNACAVRACMWVRACIHASVRPSFICPSISPSISESIHLSVYLVDRPRKDSFEIYPPFCH